MKKVVSKERYRNFLKEIKEKVYKAQYEALKAVNKRLINLYWDLGKTIVRRQEEFGWGKSIIENLSKDLQKEFPGIKGFSSQNLWRMRQFYLAYRNNKKLSPMVREISWTKNVIIMVRCKEDSEREFYIKMTKKFGWTKSILIHQIENKSYERFLQNQTSFERTLPQKYKYQAKLAVKDEYTFDFLELGNGHSERELESALINNVRKFLIEMGGYFAFIGNQYRIEVEGEEFFIDLLLYHRVLKCLIAIDLKIGDFKPEYVGKMQFYLSVLDDRIRLEGENPSIGIIICKEKNRTIVEYALKDVNKPIEVSTYRIHKRLPSKMKKYLPSPREIIESIKEIEPNG